MALYDKVADATNSQLQNQGHTVGDAIGAYQLAQKTQQMSQDLEEKKQQSEMNKSQWLTSQVVAIGRQPEGAARDLMIKGFARQAPGVFPGFNQDIPEMMKRDPQFMQNITLAAQEYMQGKITDPAKLNAWTTAATPEAIHMAEIAREGLDKVKAQQLGGQAIKAANMQDNTVLNATSKIHTDTAVVSGMQVGRGLDRALDQLGRSPTWQTYEDAALDFGNALASAKSAGISDAKLNRMRSDMSGEKVGSWFSYATNNPAAKQNLASPEAVSWLTGKSIELNKLIDQQVGAAATRRGLGLDQLHNPAVKSSVGQVIRGYQRGAWRTMAPDGEGQQQAPYSPPMGSTALPASPPASQPVKPPPKQGAVQYDPSTGKTFKVVGDHWVEQ